LHVTKQTAAEAEAWSPLSSAQLNGPRRGISRGTLETAPFHDRAEALGEFVIDAGQACELRCEPGLNHLTSCWRWSTLPLPLWGGPADGRVKAPPPVPCTTHHPRGRELHLGHCRAGDPAGRPYRKRNDRPQHLKPEPKRPPDHPAAVVREPRRGSGVRTRHPKRRSHLANTAMSVLWVTATSSSVS